MSETITVDPVEEAQGRVEFDLTPFIAYQGPEWGQAITEPHRAQGAIGETVIGSRTPNRRATIPLIVRDGGDVSFDELRSTLQAKVALWQREGGWIKRETSIGPVYARIETAALGLGGSWLQANRAVDIDASLELELSPEWLGEWVEEPENDGDGVDGAGELVRLIEPDRGDQPGHVEITVADEDSIARSSVIWGIRSAHYSSDATAALVYEAADLTPLDGAGTASGSTGESPTVVHRSDVGLTWAPVLSTEVDGVGPMTHTGSYRVYARARVFAGTSGITAQLRLVWGVGALANAHVNDRVSLSGGAYPYQVVDLGVVLLQPVAGGAHAWHGRVQATASEPGTGIRIDKIYLLPLDESAGVLRSSPSPEAGEADYMVRDEFAQTSGALDGKTANAGGTWATSGSATDFAVEDTGHTLERSATGVRRAVIGPDLTATAVRCDIKCSVLHSGNQPGIMARVPSSGEPVVLGVNFGTSTLIFSVAGGTVATAPLGALFADRWYSLQMYLDTAGNALGWFWPAGAHKGSPLIAAQSTSLATGGSRDEGPVGIQDSGNNTSTRSFDNFLAWVPEPADLIAPDGSVTIGTTRTFREHTDSTTSPGGWVTGDLPRLPAPGVEGAPSELLVIASRGDLDKLPDPTRDDDINIKVRWRPSYLYVPEPAPIP